MQLLVLNMVDVSLFFILFCFLKCTLDPSAIEYFRSERNGDFKARIVVDSTNIYRNNRNNGQLSVDIEYKAVLYSNSINWFCIDIEYTEH